MNAGGKTDLHALAPEKVDEDTAQVARTLEENARLARATMLAINRYVETMVQFLSAVSGGPAEARRRAAALGLHRLEDYLWRRMKETGLSTSSAAQPQASSTWEKQS